MRKLLKIILSSALVSVLVIPPPTTFLEKWWGVVSANPSPSEERQALEDELKRLDEQLLNIDKNITATAQEKKTLENTVASLKNKIKKLDLQISQSNIVIKDLGLQIVDTEDSIEKTSLKIAEGKIRLAAILQRTYEEDQRPLIEILISEGISDFFDNLVALESLNAKNQELLINIKALKVSLEDQKQSLDEEKNGLEKQVVIQTLQRQANASAKQEQDSLLKLTDAEYQKQLAEKTGVEKQTQAIRSRLFELIGVPSAPTFEEAYNIAKFVSGQTGIRPALLLAVLTQESNIGKNVGQCYLTNLSTGEGIRASTRARETKVMNPSRDVNPFMQITQELGRDVYNTPVSCPLKNSYGAPVGWGGAMGPSQFIPSTWVLYKDKLKNITGKPADPWNIKDAFLATGVYLKDLGGASSEFTAVMRYFSGYSWSKWEEFYGRSVLAIAVQYEQDIKGMR
ncbi:MAG: lytic murein transglycosylase [Patescibacteria group bacterium]